MSEIDEIREALRTGRPEGRFEALVRLERVAILLEAYRREFLEECRKDPLLDPEQCLIDFERDYLAEVA